MRKPRNLSAEERALWDRVADRTKPLHGDRKIGSHLIPPPGDPPKSATVPLPEFRVGQNASHDRSNNLLRPLRDRLSAAPVQMDHKAFGKLKRGKLRPEARLDLHGMTLAQAHPALVRFILASHSTGRRLVLVITGKGKDRDDGGPIPARQGVLRHQVPQWLGLPPLAQVILQVTPANLRHGGYGAYYVYLTRHR